MSTTQETTDDLLREVIFQGLGEASMCWSETPAGVFDSERATAIGERIFAAVKEAQRAEVAS